MDNKVKFEAIKPSRGAFSLSCNSLKNFVLLYPMAVTYIQRCRIYKINSCTGALEQRNCTNRDSGSAA